VQKFSNNFFQPISLLAGSYILHRLKSHKSGRDTFQGACQIVVNKLSDLLFVIPDLMDDVKLGYFDQSIDEDTYHLLFK